MQGNGNFVDLHKFSSYRISAQRGSILCLSIRLVEKSIFLKLGNVRLYRV